MKNPFLVSISPNKEMGAFDVLLQVGGLKDEKQAKQLAKLLSEWMADDGGWCSRVQ